MPAADSAAAVETVYRMEFPRVVAALAAFVGDIGLAEELAQDALVDALRQWPREGTPRNPGAWLTTVGKRKAVDLFRRNRTLATKYAQLSHELESAVPAHDDIVVVDDAATDEDIGDDRLRLIFVACHPVLAVPARVALTLRLVGGLTVPEIARAYLVPEPTVAQRIVRAKKTIANAGVPFEVPTGEDRAARLGAVLEVIYLIYNEGYSATSGEDWLRPELCAEALRLGRVLAALAPDEPEVHGLVALMEFQSSRLRARIGPSGEPVLLLDQDRRTWDRLHINRGEAALARAVALGGARGPYALQAAIAACHARCFRPEDTDWDELVALYGELARTDAIAHRRAQPRRGDLAGLGTRRRAGTGGPAHRDQDPGALPPPLQRPGRPPRPARPPRRGGVGVRPRRRAGHQRRRNVRSWPSAPAPAEAEWGTPDGPAVTTAGPA